MSARRRFGPDVQAGAVAMIREARDAELAVEVLRSGEPLERELREALADLITGKIKVKPGPKPLLPRAMLRATARAQVKELQVNRGMTRDQAMEHFSNETGIPFETLRRHMGLK